MDVNTLDPWEVPAANGEPVSLLTFPAPIPAPLAAEPIEQQVEPLGGGWITVAIVIGIMAALVALGGMVLSFRAVSTEMTPAFGAHWSWLVPVVVDLTVFVFSGVDLVLARLNMSHPLARLTVYGATAGTVYLNFSAGGDAAGRAAHVLMPSIWVVFIELMRHVVRRQTNLATGSQREPIPASRWLISPWPTLKLWRRMILWRINSYPRALEMERQRLSAIAAARALHGRAWRWRVDPLMRLRIGLAEVGAAEVYAAAAAHRRPDAGRDTEGDTQGDIGPDTRRDTEADSPGDTRADTSDDTEGDSPDDIDPDTDRDAGPGVGRLLAAAREVELWRGHRSASRISRELGIGMPLATSLANTLRVQDGLALPHPAPPARSRAKSPADKARDLRARHPAWTVEQIAKSLGVTRQTASKYLNDPKGDPK